MCRPQRTIARIKGRASVLMEHGQEDVPTTVRIASSLLSVYSETVAMIVYKSLLEAALSRLLQRQLFEPITDLIRILSHSHFCKYTNRLSHSSVLNLPELRRSCLHRNITLRPIFRISLVVFS